MSIRKKIVLSNIAIILIPCLLFTLAMLLLFFSFVGNDNMINTKQYEEQVAMEHKLFSKVKLMTTSQPENLVNFTYLEDIDRELKKLNSYLMVRVDDDVIYQSAKLVNLPIDDYLASFGEFKKYAHDSITIDDQAYKYEQYDFYFPDHKQGSIFLVKETSKMEQFMVNYHPWLFAALLLILVITNGAISYLISKNIINPIMTLKDATKKIKQGDLEFHIQTDRKDEIGELISSFEDMRGQLKKSIDLQVKYEENRKLLLSNISHDLKTPITAIKGYVEGIQDGIANTPDKVNQYMNTIYKKANDMDGMIDELFLFSKLDLKRIPFQFVETDIVDYIKECVDELSFVHKEKGIKLEFSNVYEEPVLVLADREKLMRVFTNIILNSMKYMNKPDGIVTLTMTNSSEWVEVVIEDNGPGIPEASLPFVFEQFYRADQSRNSETGGSGLGLAIAKQIIEGHGGQIWVHSEENCGTEIHFTLKKVIHNMDK
ncbi:sensor histidine kinase [Bacillus massilinigeriensis]|uniref:sensor histidine kinase n=1 Tax=Bacillus massilionigeriensis TaxID=1805475 RepID=UPI00096B1B5A|nr:HAMP domain-containing sensor histidine kinase [Bacillus massilionigeriensis]